MAREVRTSIKNASLVEERRKLIIDRAVSLFLRKGYHEASAEEIAEACGMSLGSLYRYIGSKEDIPHLIARNVRRKSDAFAKRWDEVKHEDVVTAVRECIAERIEEHDDTRLNQMFINRHIGILAPEDREALLQSVEMNVRSIERLLKRGVDSGVFEIRSPVLLAHEIIMIANSWAQRRWFLGKHFSREEYTALWTENILDLILVVGEDDRGVESKPGGRDTAVD